MPPVRRYQSPLREAQAAFTREKILMAAMTYLETHDIEALTLRQVADLSGVSPPTVYTHFPTMDDLAGAFFAWLRPRVGLDQPLPPLAELDQLPARLFPRYEEYGALLRNLMNRPSWDRQRHGDRSRRHAPWVEMTRNGLPSLSGDQARRGAMIACSFWTPTYWRWLRDTGGFDPEETVVAAGWAIRSIVGTLTDHPEGLDLPPPSAPHGKEVPS